MVPPLVLTLVQDGRPERTRAELLKSGGAGVDAGTKEAGREEVHALCLKQIVRQPVTRGARFGSRAKATQDVRLAHPGHGHPSHTRQGHERSSNEQEKHDERHVPQFVRQSSCARIA